MAAHHGRREYGSPKEPVTLEAVVVHALDDLDTRMSSFAQLFAKAPPESTWTDAKNVHGRGLLIAPPAPPDDRRFTEPGLYRAEEPASPATGGARTRGASAESR